MYAPYKAAWLSVQRIRSDRKGCKRLVTWKHDIIGHAENAPGCSAPQSIRVQHHLIRSPKKELQRRECDQNAKRNFVCFLQRGWDDVRTLNSYSLSEKKNAGRPGTVKH